MATITFPSRLKADSPGDRFARLWRRNAPMTLCGFLMIAVLGATLVGLIADPRAVINEPVWLKPAKFAISIAIYSFTLLWLLTFITTRRRLVLALSWVIATALIVEEAIIVFQALRGVRSHFNESTPFDATLFRSMAIAIVVLWMANLAVAVLLLIQRFPSTVFAWGLRFGVLIALLGMAVAFLMPRPTPAQEVQLQTGAQVDIVGAHSVAVEDGGPGLPLVGWSTVGGDLRVPHFVGLHALQAMPVIAWLLTLLPATWLSVRDRGRLMIVAGIGGLGLIGFLTWQALRGQSLIAPDQFTLTVLFSGVAVLGLAAVAVVGIARRRATALHR